jgi:sialidase-1
MRQLRLLLTLTLAIVLTGAMSLIAGPARAAVPALTATVSADCVQGRLNLVLGNAGTTAQTFTVAWTSLSGSPWTRTVPAGGTSTLYWTVPTGTAYAITSSTASGFTSTSSGIVGCGTGLSALTSYNCTAGRLQLVLENRTTTARTFTVTWPGRTSSPWTTTVAAGGNYLHYWTVGAGTAYTLRTTAPGFDTTSTGTTGCGLGAAEPQMAATTLMSTATVIKGLNGAGGTYDGTVASVRIPALAVTNNGTVLAVADARVDSAGDLGGGTNNIQLAMTRSTDRGVTWQPPYIVHHAATTSEGTGDASFLVDRSTGAVYLFFNRSPRPGIGFYSAGTGSNAANDTGSLHVQYLKSTDNGATWSAPVELNPSVKDATWTQLFASSGHGIQTSTGRLIQPIVYREASGVIHSGNIYSDDHGATWRHGGPAGSDTNESKAIETSTGAVAQDMRHNSNHFRYLATSTDQATTFGAAAATTLTDPLCNADRLSYLRPADVGSAGAPQRTAQVLFSNNGSTNARTNLTVRLSTNDGATWPARALIASGAAGYSTTAVLANGVIADLYETGNTSIVISRFSAAWLRAA